MQPELPWNVAGIGPEAREAARASARREGLSVGEWLTRRILRGLAENNPSVDRWWVEHIEPQRQQTPVPFSMQDSADMLARISRSEGETQSSWRRIEEQLKTLARRLEQAERSQTESGRAVSQATTEMNIAAREQAQALDQLGAHVTGLGDRLSRVEQGASTEGFKEAIKALHQGLSRLADQLSETTSNSATQATELATSIETVAGKLAESREDAQQERQVVEERIATLAANVSSLAGKLLETRDESGHQSQLLETRIGVSERAIERIETNRAADAALEPEIERHSAALKDLADTVETLGQKIPAIDSKLSGNIARLDTLMGGRLLSLENKLSDVTERFEASEHDRQDAGALEADMHGMAARVDSLEARLKAAVAELDALAQEATAKRVAAAPAATEPASKQTTMPQFDLPPFAAFATATAPAVAREPEPRPANDSGHPPIAADFTAAAGTATNAFAAGPQNAATEPESFLAAARRTARAATDTEQDQRRGVFSWGEPAAVPDADEREKRTRILLLAGIGVLIVSALVAGVILSRSFISPAPQPTASLPITTSTPPKPADVPAQTAATQTNTAPDAPAAAAPVPAAQSAPPPHEPRDLRARTAAAPSRLTPPSQSAPRMAKATPAQTQSATAPPTKLAALATSGNAKAEELLGLQFLDGDGQPVNEAEGAKWLERAASQGEAPAAYRLGTLYERGQGVAANPSKAVQWYSTAAKAGNRKAMHNLAVAYAQGTGVQKDMAAAAQWFSRAAALGLADSQFNLAVLYERGLGVPQSLTDAYKWYAIAASQGDAESKTRLEALDSQISAGDKANAQKAAATFAPGRMDRAANTPPDTTSLLGG